MKTEGSDVPVPALGHGTIEPELVSEPVDEIDEVTELEEAPPVILGDKLTDWDGKEVKDGSWYTKSLFEIGELEVSPASISITYVVVIIISVLCCCYCSWRNRTKI